MSMKLSIIVPVYNAEAYLDHCMETLLRQSCGEYEIILVNDGSTDGSLQLVQRYATQHPETVRYLDITNGGQGRARNFALNIARGEYIGFCDSDDWVEDGMFSKLLALAETEQADIAVCDAWRITDGEKYYEPSHPQGTVISAAGSIWNKIFRRELVGEVGFPEGVWYEDFSFSAKLLLKAQKVVFLDEALYDYRSGHPSTMRNQNSRKNLDMLRVMEDISSFAGAEHREELEFLIINHVLLDTIKRVNLQDNPEKKQVIREFRRYVHREIPRLTQCTAFRKETRNRRIVMWLNYEGLEDVGQLLLKLKGSQ